MKIGIIAALKEELQIVIDDMKERQTVAIAGFEYHTGYIGDKQVTAVQSSIGKVNAAVCADILIREFKVTHLIHVGVAGALSPELKVYDLVVSDELIYHDVDLEMYSRYFPFQRSFKSDSKLISACVSVLERMEDRPFNYKVGRIATGDVFVDDPVLRQSIIDKVDPLCVEMEGAATAQIAFGYGIPFLVIRSMSDNADDEGAVSFDTFLVQAAKYSASIVLSLLGEI